LALTRDNHYVPQLYLKNFASSRGKVCAYRILVSHSKVPIWRSFNAAGTGYEENLYTRIVHGEETDDIEQWLGREFESPAKGPLKKVIDDVKPSEADWNLLVRFLASQIVRTPAFLVKWLPRWNEMTPGMLNKTLKDVEGQLREAKASGRRVVVADEPNTEYFPLRVIQTHLPEEKKVQISAKIVVGRGLWFYTMRHMLTKTLRFLHKHRWTILEAPPGLAWFTSDDPVICLNFRSEYDYDFEGGWGRRGANILLPLSPRHVMFTEIGASSYSRRVPSRFRARLIRRMIAEHAHRQIYSLTEDSKILELRPRTVDAEAFRNERMLWDAWYEDQSRAEQNL
jgi:hypothetical protein